MVAVSRRSLLSRGARLSAGAAVILALPAIAQADPVNELDRQLARLRLAYVGQSADVQRCMVGLLTAVANIAS